MFHGEGYRKAWAKLRVERIRTSQERVRRLMREHGLQAPYRAGPAHGPKAHDGTITTAAPNVTWGTDMTSTVTVGEGASVVAVDHCTAECIGLHAAKRGTRFEALERAKVSANASAPSATGSPMGCVCATTTARTLADDFQQEVAFFGIESPRASCDPEGMGSRSVSSVRWRISCGCGASRPSKTSAWPCSPSGVQRQWMLAKYDYRSPAQVRRDFDGLDAAA